MIPEEDIGAVPLFKGLPQEQLAALAAIAVEQDFGRGQLIFSEGDHGAGFYVVLQGRVKIFKLSLEGKEQILHFMGPGEPIGEVAVFAGQDFPAYAQALEPSRLLLFPRADFVDLLQKNPTLALNMLAILSRRLRRFAHMIEDLSLKEVPGRLAAYLLYLGQRQGWPPQLELDVTKGQLASLLGTIPETLSRILARMSRQGLIASEGPRIKVLNRRGLEDLAEAQVRLSKSGPD